MKSEVFSGIMIPFIGTALGSAAVFFMKGGLGRTVQRALLGFAGGVMLAASVWSLIIPAIEQCEHMGAWAFVPAAVGLWIGTLFLLLLDRLIPHLHLYAEKAEGPHTGLTKTTMMILAVTLHNIPEGMAVGAIYAGLLSGFPGITAGGAMALAVGIAIQNLPEGAIISLPLRAGGKSRAHAFFGGVLSGVVEPLGAGLMILAYPVFAPVLPYLLSLAAGAMIYVVAEELIPEMSEGEHSDVGVLMLMLGFSLMMILDVALS